MSFEVKNQGFIGKGQSVWKFLAWGGDGGDFVGPVYVVANPTGTFGTELAVTQFSVETVKFVNVGGVLRQRVHYWVKVTNTSNKDCPNWSIVGGIVP